MCIFRKNDGEYLILFYILLVEFLCMKYYLLSCEIVLNDVLECCLLRLFRPKCML